jgi:hypothetical protein
VSRALLSLHSSEDHVTTLRTTLLRLAACAALPLAVACDSNETQPNEDHTPVTYTIFVDGVETAPPLALAGGQTVRVRLKFFNAADEDLDDVEGSHFGGLTFEPASLATVAPVTGHNYQLDVTGGTPGSGTLQVGYGHDEDADEHTFEPVAATVSAAP